MNYSTVSCSGKPDLTFTVPRNFTELPKNIKMKVLFQGNNLTLLRDTWHGNIKC